MSRFPTNSPHIHPVFLFVDVVKDAKSAHPQLPDRRDGFEWWNKIVQQFAFLGLGMGRVSELCLDGIEKTLAVIRAEFLHVCFDSLRKEDRKPHRYAYIIAYAIC